MQENQEQTPLEKEIDNIITKLLLPITDELISKTKELKEKRLEVKKNMYELRQFKKMITEKKKKLNKQKMIYENLMSGDFSNIKTCQDCLINYINLIDKKQTNFIKNTDDYYNIKLRQKELEFNNHLLDIIKEKANIEKKKNIKRKMSYEIPRSSGKMGYSIGKNSNKKIFKYNTVEKFGGKRNERKVNKAKNITPKKKFKSQNNSIDSYKDKENSDKKKNIEKQNSKESNGSDNREVVDISGEIESLINNYSSKRTDGEKNPDSIIVDNYNDGITKLKEINKETKNIENDLKDIMDNFLNQAIRTDSNI